MAQRAPGVALWAPFIVLGRRENDRRPRVGQRRLCQPVEPIALAGDGDDEPRLLGVGLDLAAQPPDQNVDAAVE